MKATYPIHFQWSLNSNKCLYVCTSSHGTSIFMFFAVYFLININYKTNKVKSVLYIFRYVLHRSNNYADYFKAMLAEK